MEELLFKTRNNGFVGISKLPSGVLRYDYCPEIVYGRFTSLIVDFPDKIKDTLDNGGIAAVCKFNSAKTIESLDDILITTDFSKISAIPRDLKCLHYRIALVEKEVLHKIIGEDKTNVETKLKDYFFDYFSKRAMILRSHVVGIRFYNDDLSLIERSDQKAKELDEFLEVFTTGSFYRDFRGCYFFPAEKLSDLNLEKIFGKGFYYIGNTTINMLVHFLEHEYSICKDDLKDHFNVEDFGDTVLISTEDEIFSEYVEKLDFYENLESLIEEIEMNPTYPSSLRDRLTTILDDIGKRYCPYNFNPEFLERDFEEFWKN